MGYMLYARYSNGSKRIIFLSDDIKEIRDMKQYVEENYTGAARIFVDSTIMYTELEYENS